MDCVVKFSLPQVEIIFRLALTLGWESAHILLTKDDDYSESLGSELDSLVSSSEAASLCTVTHALEKYPAEVDLDLLIGELMTSEMDGVIALINAETKRDFLEAVARNERSRKIRMIATDSWSIGDIGVEKAARSISWLDNPERTRDFPPVFCSFLEENSYVIVPRSSRGKSLCGNYDVTDTIKSFTALSQP